VGHLDPPLPQIIAGIHNCALGPWDLPLPQIIVGIRDCACGAMQPLSDAPVARPYPCQSATPGEIVRKTLVRKEDGGNASQRCKT
jgi:hypothetical protein